MQYDRKLHFRFFHVYYIQATTALAETTAIADFRGLTVFSAIYVVHCIITKRCDEAFVTVSKSTVYHIQERCCIEQVVST